MFYDIFKLELPRGSFGGDKWLEYYYTLDTYDWSNLTASAKLSAGMPGHVCCRDRSTSGTRHSDPTRSIRI